MVGVLQSLGCMCCIKMYCCCITLPFGCGYVSPVCVLFLSLSALSVLRTEVMNLLEKGAIEIVPPAQSESGFNSRHILVPKKDAACNLF